MAFRKIKDLAVVVSSYTDNQGQTKNRYVNVGALMESDKGQFLMLNRHFNPAGVPHRDGSDAILVSMFDPKERDGQAPRQSSAPRGSGFDSDLDDSVPF